MTASFPNHAVIPVKPAIFDDRSMTLENCVYHNSSRGKFIIFDGPDGSGKSSQVALVSALLTKLKIRHILTKQPGGSPLGAVIREILFTKIGTKNMSADALELLFMANHVENCEQVERALDAGIWVLADRWSPSAIAYMAARGVDGPVQGWYRSLLNRVAWDVFFLLTGDAAALLGRARRRRIEDHQAAKKWNSVECAEIVVKEFREQFGYLPATATIFTDELDPAGVFQRIAVQLKSRLGLSIPWTLIEEVLNESKDDASGRGGVA